MFNPPSHSDHAFGRSHKEKVMKNRSKRTFGVVALFAVLSSTVMAVDEDRLKALEEEMASCMYAIPYTPITKNKCFTRKNTYSNRKFNITDPNTWLIRYLFLTCTFIYIKQSIL